MNDREVTGRTFPDLIVKYIPILKLLIDNKILLSLLSFFVLLSLLYLLGVIQFKIYGNSFHIVLNKPTIANDILSKPYNKSYKLHEKYKLKIKDIKIEIEVNNIKKEKNNLFDKVVYINKASLKIGEVRGGKITYKEHIIEEKTIIPIIIDNINFYIYIKNITLNPMEIQFKIKNDVAGE